MTFLSIHETTEIKTLETENEIHFWSCEIRWVFQFVNFSYAQQCEILTGSKPQQIESKEQMLMNLTYLASNTFILDLTLNFNFSEQFS